MKKIKLKKIVVFFIVICVCIRYKIILKLFKNVLKQNTTVTIIMLKENRTAVESKLSLIRKMYNWQNNLFTSFRKKNCIIKKMNRPESVTRVAVVSKRPHTTVSSLSVNTWFPTLRKRRKTSRKFRLYV